MRTKGARNKKRSVQVNQGYLEVFEPNHPAAKKNGYVRQHRMVAWDAGLLTDLRMEVHHINGDKTDNRLVNLEVLTKGKHTSLHWTGLNRKPWSDERKKAKSRQMMGNENWRGDIYTTPELLESNND